MVSVLDNLGEEVTGIAFPVSLCMALTVALVKVLNPQGESSRETVLIAAAFYDEQEGDSTGKKLSGSLINGLIFVVIICAITFVLFLLFKYRCMKLIYCYMSFAVVNIFFFLTGVVVLGVLKKGNIHIDAISLCVILFNFAMVGVMGLFFWPSPILLKQGYLVIVGVVVAYIFTLIPSWTSWVVLVLMALYDLYAVLAPGGPLKALVELAIERNQEIPALVYEARPVRGGERGWTGHNRRRAQDASGEEANALTAAGPIAEAVEDNETDVRDIGQTSSSHARVESPDSAADTPLVALSERSDAQNVPIVPRQPSSQGTGRASRSRPSSASSRGSQRRREEQQVETAEAGDSDDIGLPDSLKLGLGDFIFYSVLVGRAAFNSFMTVFASYVAIIAGLGITLLLLALWKRALPALPFSIALGAVFYALTRILLEPLIVPLTYRLVYF